MSVSAAGAARRGPNRPGVRRNRLAQHASWRAGSSDRQLHRRVVRPAPGMGAACERELPGHEALGAVLHGCADWWHSV